MHTPARHSVHSTTRGLLGALGGAALSACSAAPSRNLLGSYFPTWMLCALLGLFGVLLVRLLLVRSGIDQALPLPALVYLSLWIAMTLATWLLWLG